MRTRGSGNGECVPVLGCWCARARRWRLLSRDQASPLLPSPCVGSSRDSPCKITRRKRMIHSGRTRLEVNTLALHLPFSPLSFSCSLSPSLPLSVPLSRPLSSTAPLTLRLRFGRGSQPPVREVAPGEAQIQAQLSPQASSVVTAARGEQLIRRVKGTRGPPTLVPSRSRRG